MKEISENWLSGIVENLGIGLIVLDNKGNIVHFNKEFEEFSGSSSSRLLEKNILSVANTQLPLPENLGSLIFESIFTRKSIKFDSKKYSSMSKIYDVRGMVLPIKDNENNEGIAIAVSVEKDFNNSKALAQLQESIRVKNIFADVIHHDISNSLNVISGYSDLLMGEEEDPEKIDKLRVIKRSTEKIDEIVKNASSLVKIDKLSSLKYGKVNLTSILKDILENFKPLFNKKDQILEVNLEKDEVVYANKIIEEVFSNIISNAIKYTPKGGKISVNIENENGTLIVKIRDTGPGIPNEYKKKVFTRLETGDKTGIEGTGLGLAIADGIIKFHHGKIWIEDNPGGGSVFIVRLPKVKMNNILIVDDDSEIFFVLKRILETNNYNIHGASSGAEALEKIGDINPDLVLMDIMMPDMDGWEVCKKIKENKNLKNIKVSMLSIRKSGEDIKKSFEYAHADEHLTKPIYPELLIKKVEDLLKN